MTSKLEWKAQQSKFKVFSYLFDHSRSLLIGGGSNKRQIQINSLQLLSRAEGPSVGPSHFHDGDDKKLTVPNF